MAKTLVEKVNSPDPDITIFKISGTLGFHENNVLTKFFSECSTRNIGKLVLDFSELSSLGGGCAKIIRGAAESTVCICLAGTSRAVRSFLEQKGPTSILFAPDVETAITEIGNTNPIPTDPEDAPPETSERQEDSVEPKEPTPDASPSPGSAPEPVNSGPDPLLGEVMVEIDTVLGKTKEAAPCAVEEPVPETQALSQPAAPVHTENAPAQTVTVQQNSDEVKGLKRKLVQYRALFSLNSEFSRMEDKSTLLDAFLLTTIAQVGVESAAFLELSDGVFTATCWKGFETANPESLNLGRDEVEMNVWLESTKIFELAAAPIADEAKLRIEAWDLPFAAPFIVHGRFRGIVLLGKPIRKDLDDDSWEFLSMMFNQVAIAYENSCRFEEQNERTLGLVQSLISMIESNTLSRETTERVMDLTYATAIKMHYPDEHMRDLLYGTVLRDIGMIKTSNLILRSPRELVQEEWEIIKQHPVEGAEMLKKMGFSSHTWEIVKSHHERYNGEGYPDGLSGGQIPLGGRILSVVESYAAMLQDRPQRPALTQEETLNTLKDNWGLRYDPEVVKEFIELIEEETRSGDRVSYRGIDLIKR